MKRGAEPILLITGRLENTSDKPVTYVKLQFELLGEDNVVVFRDHGYNRKAEACGRKSMRRAKALTEMDVGQLEWGRRTSSAFSFSRSTCQSFVRTASRDRDSLSLEGL